MAPPLSHSWAWRRSHSPGAAPIHIAGEGQTDYPVWIPHPGPLAWGVGKQGEQSCVGPHLLDTVPASLLAVPILSVPDTVLEGPPKVGCRHTRRHSMIGAWFVHFRSSLFQNKHAYMYMRKNHEASTQVQRRGCPLRTLICRQRVPGEYKARC